MKTRSWLRTKLSQASTKRSGCLLLSKQTKHKQKRKHKVSTPKVPSQRRSTHLEPNFHKMVYSYRSVMAWIAVLSGLSAVQLAALSWPEEFVQRYEAHRLALLHTNEADWAQRTNEYGLSRPTVSDSEAVIHLAHVQHLWQSKLFVIFLVLARWRIRLCSELQRARQ